jgi:hypothetical protein
MVQSTSSKFKLTLKIAYSTHLEQGADLREENEGQKSFYFVHLKVYGFVLV